MTGKASILSVCTCRAHSIKNRKFEVLMNTNYRPRPIPTMKSTFKGYVVTRKWGRPAMIPFHTYSRSAAAFLNF